MKITALRLYNVKRFAGRGVAIEGIGDGVNVMCAVNEFGKSTSFDALHALFFQPYSGTPDEVRRLRPYSGGSPLVEADIITATGPYRLTKQYYGSKRASVIDLASGRLVAQADEAEAFIADLVRGGTGGPAGLLWVRQGITGIERRSKSEEDGEKRVRESLLSSVQGEVEAVTGGRRMAEIMGACKEELYRLVTVGAMRPKSGGPYEEALERHRRLAEEKKRLDEEVSAMRAALDQRKETAKRLAEREDSEEKAARLDAVEKAEAAAERARDHDAKLKAAEAEAALARGQFDLARQELEKFRIALEEGATLEGKMNTAAAERDQAKSRRDAASAAVERAVAKVEVAESEERAAQDLLERLNKALLAKKTAEELAELREKLEQAEATRKEIEKDEATLALTAVPDEAIDRLQELEIELATLRATREAGLPTLRVDYREGASDAISFDGVALAGSVERHFENAELEIAGIGTLTLRSNRPSDADDRPRAAEAKRRQLLATLGVESLPDARKRQAAAVNLSSELRLLKQRLANLAPGGLAQLHQEIASRTTQSAGDLELKGDPEEAKRHLEKARQRVVESRAKAGEAQPQRSYADDGFVAAERALAALEAKLVHVRELLGPQEQRKNREEQLVTNDRETQALFEEAEKRRAELALTAPDLAAVEARLHRTRQVEQAAAQETAQLQLKLADLNGHIRTRSDDAVEEAWREAGDALAVSAARVKAFETEIAVLDTLRKALQAAQSAARDLYLQPVIAELRPLLGLLFDDITIEFDENTLLPHSVKRNGQEEEVERLSGGMREQLSVLTRLAFARLLASNGHPAPVILDDALVYSDDDRIEKMFDALHLQSRGQQIIVFSCRQRAFAKLGGNALQMTDWTPASV